MTTLRYDSYRSDEKYTHYLFRFPAKFHPPVLRRLIDLYSDQGDQLLDPFCGSGTLLVEALLNNRHAIGVDVDPLSILISRAKARPIGRRRLTKGLSAIQRLVQPVRRSEAEYDRLIHNDFSDSAVARLRSAFAIPDIPNIHHWFRNYVSIDLARLRSAILAAQCEPDLRRFFLACFASIIRNASNADPVPVSGLEVTAHMRMLDEAGRRIDPFELFECKALREIEGMAELWESATRVRINVRIGDATRLAALVTPGTVDVVMTSPPYNIAVDYYRRHTLEMYWLGLVNSHDDRLRLLPRYLGRVGVRTRSHRLRVEVENKYLLSLLKHAEGISPVRARALKHYAVSMEKVLTGIYGVLKRKGIAVIVVGNAKWNGCRVRPTRLLEQLSNNRFKIVERASYRTHNRYMSYTRQNGADIGREHVLVLQKR